MEKYKVVISCGIQRSRNMKCMHAYLVISLGPDPLATGSLDRTFYGV